MAVNLINSNDIEISQNGDDIQLNTTVDIQTMQDGITTNTNDITSLKNSKIYSTEEVDTGQKWINEKTIYRKVINLGSLPNASTKTVSTGITNTTIRLVSLTGFCCNATGTYQAGLNDVETRLNLIPNDLINITTKSNFSSFTGYAIMEYTKVAD